MTDNNTNPWLKRRLEPLSRSDTKAVDLIRAQLAAIHDKQKSKSNTTKDPESLIDTFWRQHGHKDDHNTAWHEFYAGLDDNQKQQLWDEYHQVVSVANQQPDQEVKPASKLSVEAEREDFATFDLRGSEGTTQAKAQSEATRATQTPKTDTIADTKKRLVSKIKQTSKKSGGLKTHLRPFISSVVVMLIVLLINYNPLVIAQVKQYISPGDSLQGPVIIDPNESVNVGDELKIIIPKINVDVPVVYDIPGYDEADIQTGLERGVVHYGSTAVPGEAGNNVIVGHSSNNFFNSGKYKFAFVLLDQLETGDTFLLHYQGVRYVYKVTNKQVVEPNDFSLLQSTTIPTTTLITCTPPGTSWKRLIVQGEQISPAPSSAKPVASNAAPDETEAVIVPGNSPSLWSRFSNWLFGD